MRLIDADAFRELIDGGYDLNFDDVPNTKKELLRMIDDAPTVSPDMAQVLAYECGKAKRKRGEWLELTNTNHTYVCSVCGRMLVNITDGKNNVAKKYPYCHCGADMRGEEE